MKARRYNKGKLRYELLPENALKDIVEVYTKGAEKYTLRDKEGNIIDDGANNWRKGLSWSSMLGSIERHIRAFKQGEDLDPELGTKHLANAAWGLMGLLEYYKIYPQGDDRQYSYLNSPKIALDIDEVIADWMGAWCKYRNLPNPTNWYFDRELGSEFKRMEKEGILDDFYMNIKPLLKPENIPFEPYCYITSRPISSEISQQWLDMHGFPTRPVYTVTPELSKVEIAKREAIDIMVDDSYTNFLNLNKAGICCYLYDASHNQRYNVGYKRIKELKELL